MKGLKNDRAGGASKIRAAHMNTCLRGMIDEEERGNAGAGEKRKLLIFQSIWEKGCLLRQKQEWVIFVLLPKGRGDFRGIRLIDPCWKVVEVIMDK